MLNAFFQWLTTSGLANAINSKEWVFPVIQSFHFIGFALLIGTIAMVDLRVLGFGMRRQQASEIGADLNSWTYAGLALMLTTGPLMFSTDAYNYHFNPSFQIKMVCLMAALLFHFTLHRRAIRPDAPAMAAKAAAAISLLLWSAVVFAGRMIAFI